MRKLLCLALLCISLLCVSPGAAAGQSFDASSGGGPVAISTTWRFHTGDDPQWASPDFDDSHWSQLRIEKTWAAQGYRGYSGYAWYRAKIKLPSNRAPLALGFKEICSADEVYADGRLIGSIGKMRPAPVWLAYSPYVYAFPIPQDLNGRTIELAIRVWQPQASSSDVAFVGLGSNPLLGTAQTIENLHQISVTQFAFSRISRWILGAIAAGIGLFSLGLFFLRIRSTEYAWAALFLLAAAFVDCGYWFYHALLLPALGWIVTVTCVEAAMLIFWLLFIWRFLGAPADKLLRTGIILLVLVPIPSFLAGLGYIGVTQANLTWVFVPLVLGVLVFARLVRLAWRGNREAQLLLIPFLLSSLMSAVNEIVESLYWVGAIKVHGTPPLYRGTAFSVTWVDLFELLSNLAVAVLLMLRFTRSAERDERLSAEMEAASRVQMQLVPTDLPVTPHFRFEVAYLAASEVGGDFYQVFPLPNDSVLIVVGDVSGKGLKAAMLGTLVVGALRTLTQENLGPSQILTRLNHQLIGSSDGGFVTCLILRISSTGAAELANAGHLSPYLGGSEITIENGLPLGLDPDTAYPETRFQLPQGTQLTLLSDGVIEARNSSGELFGFERTAAASTEPAESIARAASTFGQEDDITVLTITRPPGGREANVNLETAISVPA